MPTKYQEKIVPVTWYLGGPDGSKYTAKQFYNDERDSSKVYSGNASTWEGKIGLMYMSDYMYAAAKDKWTLYGYNYDSSLEDKGVSSDYRSVKEDDWLLDCSNGQWTITHRSSLGDHVFYVNSSGNVYNVYARIGYAVRPVFYLESNVTFSRGNGTLDEPFII